MLKKALIASAVTAAFSLQPALAQEAPANDKWIAGFAQYYNADSSKPDPAGYFDDGHGYGGEFGFRFEPEWAVRVEVARQKIDVDPFRTSGSEEEGNSFGLDMLYFLENDAAYLFGGLRHQALEQSYRAAAAGVGKHWNLSERWKVVTEATWFHDFGQGYNDFGVKLGLAYYFGDSVSTPQRDGDADGDGVLDSRDQCSNTPMGTSVDATGCNNDSDADGVVNSVDQCPNTPRGTAVDSQGCALVKDSDNDGVANSIDACPNTPATDKVDAKGCTVFAEHQVSVVLDVLFANDSAVVTDPRDAKIVEFAEFMNRYDHTDATIEGHSSAVGDADYNMDLSQRRAQSFVDVLVNTYGINRSRLSAVGYGETQLLDERNVAEAHRVNRRIHAKVVAQVKEKETR
ncbi:OmpA family protein [Alteromonas oceanisediminis]|uniref:OmpA family protein n=1 Tax=Alteromonas oceanisediminis TaxID=2836180 RepID=UPI001BD9CB35|nr:OmpA family protein [Alteromonas oceanisediminis]MBT0586923.1 OmpA family protein [Alteromonas oceanisediminis]